MNDMAQPNFKTGALYRGDNLDFLRAFDSESIDLIATDPPFNKGRDFHATPESLASGASFTDRWSWDDENDVQIEWLLSLQAHHPKVVAVIESARLVYGDDLAAFLCWMGVRLLEMHRVLKPTGSLYLHCDPTASHYLKALLDAIFGKHNFRNEIVWKRVSSSAKGSQHSAKSWGVNNDTILYYTKTSNFKLNPTMPLVEQLEIERKFPKIDENGERYNTTAMPLYRSKSLGARPNLCYEWRGFKNPHPSGWRLSRERLDEEFEKGNVVIRSDGKLERRAYLRDYKGVPAGNVWTDIVFGSASKERTGYPTQKPLALYERIIKASSNEGDIVLDPFAGCATTTVAAQRLNRRWVAMDIWEGAHEIVLQRMKNETTIFDADSVEEHLEPPIRTDGGRTAANPLPEVKKIRGGRKRFDSKAAKEQLLAHPDWDWRCDGCDTFIENPRFFEVDHDVPISKGGSDDMLNLVLICGPCNRTKSNKMTREELRTHNWRQGNMAAQIESKFRRGVLR